jgi:polyhydroxyalkanoate synthesis repressor PhaR
MESLQPAYNPSTLHPAQTAFNPSEPAMAKAATPAQPASPPAADSSRKTARQPARKGAARSAAHTAGNSAGNSAGHGGVFAAHSEHAAAPENAAGRPSRPRKQAASASEAAPGAAGAAHSPAERVLKKYPNRRLYDSQTSSYITLSDVKAMVLKGVEFVVRDAKTGEDITRSILLQIILEEESGGVPLFTSQTLSQIIRFYGHAMQGLMGNYLERNMQILSEMQQRFTDQAKGMVDGRMGAADAWTQLLKGGPLGQAGLMGNYLEQSKAAMSQFQEQMGKQAQAMMAGLSAFKKPRE